MVTNSYLIEFLSIIKLPCDHLNMYEHDVYKITSYFVNMHLVPLNQKCKFSVKVKTVYLGKEIMAEKENKMIKNYNK